MMRGDPKGGCQQNTTHSAVCITVNAPRECYAYCSGGVGMALERSTGVGEMEEGHKGPVSYGGVKKNSSRAGTGGKTPTKNGRL